MRKSALFALVGVFLSLISPANATTLTITTPPQQTAVSGTLFSLQILSSGGTGSNQFTIASGTLPTGLSLNANSGVISGTPSTSESRTVTVRVTDGSAATATTNAIAINTGWMVTTFAGTPGVDAESGVGGQATSASFLPHGLSIRRDGVVYFSDANTAKLFRIGLDGVLSLILTGSGLPTGIIARDNGDLFFNTYTSSSRIFRYTASTQTTAVWSSEGTSLFNPRGAISDSAGNIYVADFGSHRIRKIDTTGAMTVIAGSGSPGGSGDGGVATSATLTGPGDVAVDSTGTVYFTEINHNRIRKINPDGTMAKVLGDGSPVYSGDGALATSATTAGVWGIAVDGGDNLFFVEKDGTAIRRIDATTGIVTRVAGTGILGTNGSPVNGISSRATFSNLLMVSRFDRDGNLYIIDYSNRVIRRIAQIGVPFPIPQSTISLSSSGLFRKGIPQTLTAVAGVAGKVTFSSNGKRLPGCIGRTAIGTTPISVTCAWRPHTSGSFIVRAVLTPTDSSLSTVTSEFRVGVERRSTRR